MFNTAMVLPPIKAFDANRLTDEKAIAVKVIEEASELLYASQHETQERIVEEFSDVLQSLANFAFTYGIDNDTIADAIVACEQRNRDKGRITGTTYID